MTENRKSALSVCVCTLIIISLVTAFATTLRDQFLLGNPGTVDYVQYWSAFRALQQGLNPYDGEVLHEIQRSVGQRPETTILMWNPPWACLLLAPFLALPFNQSAALWFLFSVSLLFVIAWAAIPCFSDKRPPPYIVAVLCCALFYPVIECLSWGQLSIFITTAFTLTMYLLRRGSYSAAGLSLLPLTLKPHLFFLLAPLVLLLLWRLSRPHRRELLIAACAGMLLTIMATEMLWPGALAAWVNSFQQAPRGPGVVPTQQWMTATLATALRSFLSNAENTPPTWPLIALPSAAFTVMSIWVVVNRGAISPLPNLILRTLCLSLLLGNYGWLFDQSLLVLCQLSILCDSYRTDRTIVRGWLLGGLGGVWGAVILCRIFIEHPAQHHYTWLPAAMLLLMWLGHRSTRIQREPLRQSPHRLYESPDPSS
jgi:hypothetical protein